MLTVATVNVNGIRAAFRRGMGEWLDVRKPDVLLLQEVRGSDEILADHLSPDEWHLAHEAGRDHARGDVPRDVDHEAVVTAYLHAAHALKTCTAVGRVTLPP